MNKINQVIDNFIVKHFWRTVKIETAQWNHIWGARKCLQAENVFIWKGHKFAIYIRCDIEDGAHWEAWLISSAKEFGEVYFDGAWQPIPIMKYRSYERLYLKKEATMQAKKLILKQWLKYTWVSTPTW